LCVFIFLAPLRFCARRRGSRAAVFRRHIGYVKPRLRITCVFCRAVHVPNEPVFSFPKSGSLPAGVRGVFAAAKTAGRKEKSDYIVPAVFQRITTPNYINIFTFIKIRVKTYERKCMIFYFMVDKKYGLRRILAVNLKEHRKVLGLSQEKLAELADVSWQTVNSIECHRTWVSDKTLESLANALKIETFQLLLPVAETVPRPITCDDAIKKLVKIKRSYDDSFNEIVNLIK
jgi:DNA-binding XRE family transcriptional regulator